MASEAEKTSKTSEKSKKLTQDQIVSTFNVLRQEQKSLVTRLADLEQELNEHGLVVEALKGVDKERVCYRMIGGILAERTVKEVLPEVANNKDQLAKYIETLSQQIEKKGREINEFKEKYNIHFRKDAPSLVSVQNKEESQSSSSVLVDAKS